MVYNKIDQVVFTQDANQRTGTQWTFTKYDAMGREILTGLYTDGSTRLVLQASVTASVAPLYESRTNATATGYSNVALPTTSITNYWVQSYYDDYDFLGMGTTYPPNGVISYRIKGLLTGKKVFQTNLAASYWTMYYYDEEGREKEIYAQNQLSGYDRIINTYNFASELTGSVRTHVANAVTTTIANTYHYDHRGRSVAATSNINNQGEVVLNRNYYNEIGQLNQKNLHSADAGSSYLQASLLRYNERGWLSSSSSNPFSFQLNYNDGTTPQYNGNVANQLWGAAAVLPNTFTYGYDKLNRLTSGASTGIAMSEAMAYDLSGNIIALTRDALSGSYNYSGNRLTNITGTLGTGSYIYDANGNATTDGRNGVVLAYNFLNLPASATKTGLNLAYTYSAEGVKLRRTNSTTSTTTDYVEGIQYSNNVLQFIQTTEGRAANVGGTYIYEYDLKDHLGNVRLTLRKVPETGVLAVLQKDDYYPFGKQKIAINGNNKYLYNSKELQEGLEQYDYGARFYDPVIARWLVVDPMAEFYDDVSPYNYGLNNPINNIDPDGRAVEGLLNDYVFDKEGNLNMVVINDKPDRFFQINDAGKVNEIGADKMTIEMTGQYLAESSKHIKDGGTLNEVEIRGEKFQPIMPVSISLMSRVVVEKGLEMSFPLEKLLPGTRLIASAANILGNILDLTSTLTYTPAPKELKGFPSAKRAPNKGRARWKTSEGKILEWDSQHGDVEVYDKQGRHQGSADPNTGQMTKGPVPGRTTRN